MLFQVQQQPNFTDCGIFLMQFVESFFKFPVNDFTIPITHLKNWFDPAEVKRKENTTFYYQLPVII
jgi:sentrin-specific protease 7